MANVINPFLYAMFDYGPPISCRSEIQVKCLKMYSTIFFCRRISRAKCNNNDEENSNIATEKNNRVEVKTDLIIYNLSNLFYENHDVAMSSSRTDSVMGLNILSNCPGWEFLNINTTL